MQGIDRIEVKPVTAAENPYAKLFKPAPTGEPAKMRPRKARDTVRRRACSSQRAVDVSGSEAAS